MPVETESPTVPIHQWTNNEGEVLILRFSGDVMISRLYRMVNGQTLFDAEPFQHPMAVGEVVAAPDWTPNKECGGGIHGWPWGIGLGDGKEPDWSALWQVYGVKPEDIVGDVDGGPKCKFKTGALRYKGDWHGAAMFILEGQMAWAVHASRGAASNSGYSGAASNSGDSGAASNSGYSGAASNSGYRGAASNSGDSGAASNSGDSGAASNSGYSGAALSTGMYSSAESSAPGTPAVVSGLYSRARAGEFGCIALAWWNEKEQRTEMRTALTGSSEGSLKPSVWYRLNDEGEFVEDK